MIITTSKTREIKQLLSNRAQYTTELLNDIRYPWTGTIKDYTDKQFPNMPGVVAIFADPRESSAGKYVVFVKVIDKTYRK